MLQKTFSVYVQQLCDVSDLVKGCGVEKISMAASYSSTSSVQAVNFSGASVSTACNVTIISLKIKYWSAISNYGWSIVNVFGGPRKW